MFSAPEWTENLQRWWTKYVARIHPACIPTHSNFHAVRFMEMDLKNLKNSARSGSAPDYRCSCMSANALANV